MMQSFNSPKRNKNRRSVKLAALALDTLRAHRQRQSEEREILDGLWQDHGLVFTSTIGTPLNRHNVFGRSFKPLLNKASLPHTAQRFATSRDCAAAPTVPVVGSWMVVRTRPTPLGSTVAEDSRPTHSSPG